MSNKDGKLPQFALIKQFLREQIESGKWSPGTRIPSEHSLTQTFSVSRMTARRAVKELADEGLFTRTPGLGTFVNAPSACPAVLDIVDVVAKAQVAGSHSHRLLAVDCVQATAKIAHLMQLQSAAMIFQLTVLHLQKNQPVQWQSLSINPSFAPALLKQKLTRVTPDAYLNWISPSTSTQYQLKAVAPSASQRLELALSQQDAPLCLQLSRRNWLGDKVVSFSTMLHPADHYYLGADLEAVNQ
ncbi:MAG: GntR family transcriptional regulator [Porticoccaceae bacterium]|nr:GntR family transcriptional regulator [Porticoccaceae bacterium]